MGLGPVILALVAACGLRGVLPGEPVLSVDARAAFELAAPSGAAYTGPPRVEFPVLPQQIWGLRYGLDVVLESTHPDWIMHEYARVDLPNGPLWVAKDADAAGNQTIVADLPDIEAWVPEVPVPRLSRAILVHDRSTAETVDLHLEYENPKGQRTVVTYRGPAPTEPSKPRNGNTMGHSRGTVAALLDLHLFRAGGDATISIDGEAHEIRRMWGLYPMKFILAQTQAGFAIADFRQEASADGFRLTRPAERDWPTRAVEEWKVVDGWATREGPVTTLRYHFAAGELDHAEVRQVGMEAPALTVAFNPALPDLRRPFTGEAVSRFAADVAGQPGHGTGEVRCRWIDADTVRVDLVPTAPPWFADRPLTATIHFDGGAVRTRIERSGG